MVLDHAHEHPSQWHAIFAYAGSTRVTNWFSIEQHCDGGASGRPGLDVVDGNWIGQSMVTNASVDVVDVLAKLKLRRGHTDDDQPERCVHAIPSLDVRGRANPVHARVLPEIDEHDVPAQCLGGERRRIHPPLGRSGGKLLAALATHEAATTPRHSTARAALIKGCSNRECGSQPQTFPSPRASTLRRISDP